MSTIKNDGSTVTSGGGNPPLFTKRELECIDLLIQYAPIAKIAKSMNIAENTVEFYLTNIRQKTKAAIQPLKKS